jgi:hypothetical protein
MPTLQKETQKCSVIFMKGCLKPEAYCSSPLGGPKYKEKKTREARLGLESMFRIIDPSPLPIPDRQSKMLPGWVWGFLKVY